MSKDMPFNNYENATSCDSIEVTKPPYFVLKLKPIQFLVLAGAFCFACVADAQQQLSEATELPALELVKESILSPSLLQLVDTDIMASPIRRPGDEQSEIPSAGINIQEGPDETEETISSLPEMPLPTQDRLIQLRIVLLKDSQPNRVVVELENLGMQSLQRRGLLITGRLPVSQVESLVAVSGISDVRPSFAGVRSGVTKTQGDEASNADIARTVASLSGSGITVGILSDSYNCRGQASTDMSNGDLPVLVNVLNDNFCGTDEGRAMMQIVHDMAPGASLAFHTAFLGELDFADGINELVQSGADVIVDDVFYYEEPFFQDGFIAQAARDASLISGVPYFASAGNAGRTSWEGSYASSGQSIISTGDAHKFGTDEVGADDVKQSITVEAGRTVVIVLQWDDPYSSLDPTSPGPDTDLDIALLNGAGTVVALSADTNIGSDPYEYFVFRNGPNAQTFEIVIEKQAGPDPTLMKWVGFQGVASIDEYDTASGTVVGHANAESVLSVGAVNYTDTPRFGASFPILASYSSGGPAPILFSSDGIATGPIIRGNPDFTAPDAGNNTIIGHDSDGDKFPNFFGTSASVVHAASVAALLLEHNPSMTPADVENALESSAIDHGVAGYDSDTGHGLIDADAILQTILIPPQISNLSPGALVNGSTLIIDWEANDFNVDTWRVLIGTSEPVAGVASSDVFSSGLLVATDMTIEAGNLPSDGSTLYLTLEWTSGNTSGSTTIDFISGSSVQPSLVSPVPFTTDSLLGSNVDVLWTSGTTTVSEWRLRIGVSGVLSSDIFDSGPIVGSETGVTATGIPLAGELLFFTLDYTVNGVVQTLDYTFNAIVDTDFFSVPPGEWRLMSIPATSSLTFADFVEGHLDVADFNDLSSDTPWIAFRYDADLVDSVSGELGTYSLIDLSESLVSLFEGFWLLHLYPEAVEFDLPVDAVYASGLSTPECAEGFFCESVSLPFVSGGWAIGSVPSPLEPTLDILRLETSGTGTICDIGCDLLEAEQQGLASADVWIYEPSSVGSIDGYVALDTNSSIPRWSGFWISTTAIGGQGTSELEIPVR